MVVVDDGAFSLLGPPGLNDDQKPHSYPNYPFPVLSLRPPPRAPPKQISSDEVKNTDSGDDPQKSGKLSFSDIATAAHEPHVHESSVLGGSDEVVRRKSSFATHLGNRLRKDR